MVSHAINQGRILAVGDFAEGEKAVQKGDGVGYSVKPAVLFLRAHNKISILRPLDHSQIVYSTPPNKPSTSHGGFIRAKCKDPLQHTPTPDLVFFSFLLGIGRVKREGSGPKTISPLDPL